MNIFKKSLIFGVFALAVLAFLPQASFAYGYNPNLSVTSQGGDSVRVTVSSAAPYGQITLYQRQGTTLWTTITNFGQTDGSGYFSQIISLGSINSNSPVEQYVTVAGDTSNTVQTYPNSTSACTAYGCVYPPVPCAYPGCGSTISLSQTSVTLGSGQSSVVYVYGVSAQDISSGRLNISISNSNVVNAYLSQSASGQVVINMVGKNSGSTTISVCSNYASSCASLYVTVTGAYTGSGNVWFNPSNPTLYVGQSLAVSVNSSVPYLASPSVSGAYYYVSSNSNSNAVSASVSGSVLNLYAYQSGTAIINVCHSSLGFCGNLTVTVSGGSGSGTNAVSIGDNFFSPRTVTVAYGTTVTWTNNGSMTHTVTADDNSWGSGNLSPGQSYSRTFYNSGTFNYHCIFHGGVGGVGMSGTVTVSGSGSGGQVSMSLSPTSVSVAPGQTASVSGTVSSPSSGIFYVANNPNSSIATVSVNGSTINVYGVSNGSTTANICYTNAYNCVTLSITVGGYGSGNVTVTPSYVNLSVGSSQSVSIYSSYNSGYGYYGYTVGYNSNSSVVSATVSGNTLNLYGVSSGSATVQVCQLYNSSNCATVSVNVSGGNYGSQISFNTTVLSQPVVGQYYSQQLQVGGGTTPYSFALNYGSLPSGLTLSTAGLISGTPQSTAYTSFNVRVTDYYGRSATQSFTLTPTGGTVLGANQYANGTLISENNTIYIVYKNTKTGFANWNTFAGLGFRLGNVQYVGYSGLNNSGYVVSTPYASHPWGSWVRSGNTVYFVHESGLIPVADYATFLNNGGQDYMTVPANNGDFTLPLLPIMTFNDYRLR